jgi:exonuclease III
MRPIRWLFAGLMFAAIVLPGCRPDEAAPARVAGQLRVMTFDIGSDDAPVSLDQVAAAIRAADADIVGFQETDGNEHRIAEIVGWKYADQRLHLISRFPLFPTQRNGGAFAYVEVAAGRFVAVANMQLPPNAHGPHMMRGDVTAFNEFETRLSTLTPIAKVLPALAADKVPTFLTGGFNASSHLDGTEATRRLVAVKYPMEWIGSQMLAKMGFTDSFRAVHSDPVAQPGATWIPSRHPQQSPQDEEAPDRIDFVYSIGPAKAVDSKVVGEARSSGQADIAIDPWPSDHRAVVSTFEIEPAPMPHLLIVDPALVATGDLVTVKVITRKADERGVIGIFQADKPETEQPITSQPPERSDHLTATFGTVRLNPGKYIAAFTDSAGNRLASTEFRVQPALKPHLQVKKASVNPGDPIDVMWRGAPGNKSDWIGIYKADEPNLSSFLARIEANSAVNGQATFAFEAFGDDLQPGKYEVRLMLAGGYVELANARFVVSNPNAKPGVAVPVARVRAGEPVTVSWKDSPGNDKDYIGIYKADEEDLHHYLTYLYTDGEIDGSVTFKPAKFVKTPGEYVARLMVNDGYDELASVRFWVIAADGKPLVSIAKARINPGDPVEVRWTSTPAGERALIRIHDAADPGFNQILAQHLDTSAATDGEFTFKAEDFSGALEPGDYKVRMMREDGSEEFASAQFRVLDPNALPQVVIANTTIKAGEPIVVSWKNSPGNQHDWIGLYRAGTSDTHQYLTWLYTDGALDGTVTFSVEKARGKLPPGEYKASLLVNDGYNEIASTTFTVTAP